MTVMAHTWMSAPTIATDTEARKWAQGVHDAFASCGLVQTADTGQAVISELEWPASGTSAVAGYELWTFDDGLAPVVIKVEYARAGNSGGSPAVGITVGTGSDGAGAVTGIMFPRAFSSTINSAGDSAEFPSYASGDGSSINIAAWPGAVSSPARWFLSIERQRDLNGDPLSGGLLIAFTNATLGNARIRVIGYGGTTSSMCTDSDRFNTQFPRTINGVDASSSSTLSKDGVEAPVLPIPLMAPGVAPWVSTNLVAVHPGDAGTTSVIQAATINGKTRIYRAFPYVYTGNAAGPVMLTTGAASNATAGALPAILWPDEE